MLSFEKRVVRVLSHEIVPEQKQKIRIKEKYMKQKPSLTGVNKILALRRIKSKLEKQTTLVNKKLTKEENALKTWLKYCQSKRGVINSYLIEIRPSGKLTISTL